MAGVPEPRPVAEAKGGSSVHMGAGAKILPEIIGQAFKPFASPTTREAMYNSTSADNNTNSLLS